MSDIASFKDRITSLVTEGYPLIIIPAKDLHYIRTELSYLLDPLPSHIFVHWRPEGFTQPIHVPGETCAWSAKKFVTYLIEEVEEEEDIFSDFLYGTERTVNKLLSTRDKEDIFVLHASTERKEYILLVELGRSEYKDLRSSHSILESIESTKLDEKRTLILLLESGHSQELKEIKDQYKDLGVVVEAPMPDDKVLGLCLDSFKNRESVELSDAIKQKFIEELRGSTITEANRLIDEIYKNRDINRDIITKEKIRHIKNQINFLDYTSSSGVLSYITTSDTDILAGAENLKRWVQDRCLISEQKATEYGIKPPKGIILTGPPGCGKSMAAKTIAVMMQRPLFQIGLEGLFQKHVGVGEQLARQAFQEIDSLGPIVVIIDEVEKCLGDKGSQHESSVRLLGQLLSWLNDRTSLAFVICTTNNLRYLPPEFSRPGRFDATFYIPLPSKRERAEILRYHLRGKKNDLKDGEVEELASLTDLCSGAELEMIVQSGLITACLRGDPLTIADLKKAALESPPLAKRRPEIINQYCETGNEVGISASHHEEDIADKNIQEEWMVMYQ